MSTSPSAGGAPLFQGPASGFIPVSAQIGEGELLIAQVNELSLQLAQKHPLIGPGALPQDRVAGLVSDLQARALSSEVATQLVGKAGVAQVEANAAATTTALALKADQTALDALGTTVAS